MHSVSAYSPSGNDKIWAIFSHLAMFVGAPLLIPLVVYLAMRGDSEYVTANAREALNFHLSMLLYSLCCIPLVFVIVGIPLLVMIGLVSVVLSIIGAIKASDGGCFRYPITIRFVR